jgi:hypothetical protein
VSGRCVATTHGTRAKHYDEIGRFMSDSILLHAEHAGVVDFMG